MTDDLVTRLDDINRNYDLARGVHSTIRDAKARISALTAERDYTEGTNDTLIALHQALTADNARLRKALTDIVADCEATYPPSHGAIKYAARLALNTGKELSHE
jgi:hypothetical protein